MYSHKRAPNESSWRCCKFPPTSNYYAVERTENRHHTMQFLGWKMAIKVSALIASDKHSSGDPLNETSLNNIFNTRRLQVNGELREEKLCSLECSWNGTVGRVWHTKFARNWKENPLHSVFFCGQWFHCGRGCVRWCNCDDTTHGEHSSEYSQWRWLEVNLHFIKIIAEFIKTSLNAI